MPLADAFTRQHTCTKCCHLQLNHTDMKENTFKMFHPYSMWWRRNERYRKFAGMLSWKTLTPRMGGHRRDVRTRARARAYFMRSLARSPRVGPDRRRRCRCRSPCRFFRSGTKERSGPKITQKIGDSGEFFSRPTTDRPIVPTKECSNSKTSLLNRPTAFFSLQIRERTDRHRHRDRRHDTP